MKNIIDKEAFEMFEPLVPKLTPREDLWETAQALKVLAFSDLRYTDEEEWLKEIKYEPYPYPKNTNTEE